MDNKRINKYEFNEILRNIVEISPKEREYLNRVFAADLVDGLTEFELRKKIATLKFDAADSVDIFEAEKIKNKLLERLGK